jgi:hypothetical protein
MAVSFIGGGNQRKPPTCCKSLVHYDIIELLLKVPLTLNTQNFNPFITKMLQNFPIETFFLLLFFKT